VIFVTFGSLCFFDSIRQPKTFRVMADFLDLLCLHSNPVSLKIDKTIEPIQDVICKTNAMIDHAISVLRVNYRFASPRAVKTLFNLELFVLKHVDMSARFDPAVYRRFKEIQNTAIDSLLDSGVEYFNQPCSDVIAVHVVQAFNLIKKDAVTNSYCIVHYGGLKIVSRVVSDSLDPVFDFKIPLLRHANDQLVISLWNSRDQKQDQFLGLAKFNLAFGSFTQSLQKRSPNSHVSGTLSVVLSNCHNNNNTNNNNNNNNKLDKSLFRYAISSISFAELLTSFALHESLAPDHSLDFVFSKHSQRILDIASAFWCISIMSVLVAKFQIYSHLYSKNLMSLTSVSLIFAQLIEPMSLTSPIVTFEEKQILKDTYDALLVVLTQQSSLIYENMDLISAAQLRIIFELVDLMRRPHVFFNPVNNTTDTFVYLSSLLKAAAKSRFDSMNVGFDETPLELIQKCRHTLDKLSKFGTISIVYAKLT
jgi:hypothetical protein